MRAAATFVLLACSQLAGIGTSVAIDRGVTAHYSLAQGFSPKRKVSVPRTLSLLFPDGKTEFWLTEQTFAVGDKITRNGQTWVVAELGNFNRDGKALAVRVRQVGEEAASVGSEIVDPD